MKEHRVPLRKVLAMIQWYVRHQGEDKGPFTAKQLVELAGKGNLTPEHEVRKGAEGRWVKASQVKGLFGVENSTSGRPARTAPSAKHSPASESEGHAHAELAAAPPSGLRDKADESLESLQPWLVGAIIVPTILLMFLKLWDIQAKNSEPSIESLTSGLVTSSPTPRVPSGIMLIVSLAVLLPNLALWTVSKKLNRRRRERMLERARTLEGRGLQADVCPVCNGAGYTYFLSRECASCVGAGYSVTRRGDTKTPVELPVPYPGLFIANCFALLGFIPMLGLLFGTLAFVRARRASKAIAEHPTRYTHNSSGAARFGLIVGGLTIVGNALLVAIAILARLWQ